MVEIRLMAQSLLTLSGTCFYESYRSSGLLNYKCKCFSTCLNDLSQQTYLPTHPLFFSHSFFSPMLLLKSLTVDSVWLSFLPWFPCTLETLMSAFASAELLCSLSTCILSAWLRGSGTAHRGSHVWLSQSCEGPLRASREQLRLY